jgi:hypothetical protein
MGLYRSRIDFLLMFEVVQFNTVYNELETSHKSDELKHFFLKGVHKSGTYD